MGYYEYTHSFTNTIVFYAPEVRCSRVWEFTWTRPHLDPHWYGHDFFNCRNKRQFIISW